MKALKRVITFMLFALIGMTCTKEDTPKAGKGNKVEVSTLSISPTVSTVVNISGSVKTDMLELIIERGFCWNNTQLPTINDNSLKVSVSGGFNATISGLVPGTNYSIRAYIKTTNDLVYGNEVKFKTINIPIVFTSTISGLTNNTAISGGSISSDGGSNIISRGICWNTTGSPTVANTRTQDGTGVGAFSSTLTGLTPGTLYYARAYATNAAGTAYGAQITFTTVANPIITLPTLSTSSVSSITTTTALSGGSISADGGGSITSRGVCWNTTGSPTVANTRTQDGTGVGAFSSSLTGLTPGTLYYARAYATNAAGTAYGTQIVFTTSPAVVETCSISTATNGTVYTMQTPALGTIVNAGSLYKITMASPIFSFGQASEVAIYRNETKVFSFGSFLVFNEAPGNARTFTIPAGLVSSPCYTIRVTKPEGTITAVYVSPRFEIR
jgi:hypothetical protein